MRTSYSTALAAIITVSFALAASTMARGPKEYGPGNNPGLSKMSQKGLQHSQFGRNTAVSHIKAHSTPPGHHYGWQKGRHNPHASPTP
jgi:hypothetical protein